jgi:hypothetical protein
MNLPDLEGRTVRARALGSGALPEGDWTLDESDVPTVVTHIGTLTINWVEALGYTQYIVNGIPVDPNTIHAVDLPGTIVSR